MTETRTAPLDLVGRWAFALVVLFVSLIASLLAASNSGPAHARIHFEVAPKKTLVLLAGAGHAPTQRAVELVA